MIWSKPANNGWFDIVNPGEFSDFWIWKRWISEIGIGWEIMGIPCGFHGGFSNYSGSENDGIYPAEDFRSVLEDWPWIMVTLRHDWFKLFGVEVKDDQHQLMNCNKIDIYLISPSESIYLSIYIYMVYLYIYLFICLFIYIYIYVYK